MTYTRPLTLLVFFLFVTTCVTAQSSNKQLAEKVNEAYQIPFASQGNQLELAVANVGAEQMNEIEVVAISVPDWLNLDTQSITLTGIDPSSEDFAVFDFSVDREAEVGESRLLSFEIRSGTNVIGKKEFLLAVQAPQEVKLDQNYPNPFSGQTRIGFDVPQEGRVQIAVYDMLGRQVTQLVDEAMAPGHHVEEWDGGLLASGIYFYVLKASSQDGTVELRRNKMILVK